MGTKESMKKNKKMRKNKDITVESQEFFEEDKKSNKSEVETNKDRVSAKKRKGKKEQMFGVSEAVQTHPIGGSKKAHKKGKVQSSSMEVEKSQDKEEADTNQVVQVPSEVDGGLKRKKGKSKDAKKKKTKDNNSSNDANSKEKEEESGGDEEDVYLISSGDEDSSKGMKKWISEYHQSMPGLTVLQHRIDEFMTAHEEKLEQERKEKEARAAEGGWTVVTHHKGRKKTTEDETGVTVGSVAQAVVEDRLAKKKSKQVGLDFYRFQKKEAHRNDIMALQSKFQEDMKRLQQLRAARKFRPY